MPVTFLHSADWQLGKPFARVTDPEKRAILRQERLQAITRIGSVARERGAAFLLVAGDLFDSPTIAKSTVSQACSAIGQLGIPVLAIPGNHDHGGPGCLWEQEFFLRERESLAPNLRILLAPEPLELDSAVVFPCPLLRRHESSDPTAWLRQADEAALASSFGAEKPRILLAHGSVQDFDGHGAGDGEEEDPGVPNLIDLDRLPPDLFDYVALGDWHGTRKIHPRAWYSGTPEPDRFPKGADNDPGNILAVSARRGAAPAVEKIATSRLGWHSLDFEFAGDGDVAALEEKVSQLAGKRAGQDLLRLSLRGSLGIEATTRLETLVDSWQSRLLRLKLNNETAIAPNPGEIEALTRRTGDPLISAVAIDLVQRSDADGEAAAVARIALRELHAAVSDLS